MSDLQIVYNGKQISIPIFIRNEDTSVVANNTEVLISFSAGIDYVSYTATEGTYDNTTKVWTIPTINPSQSVRLNLVVEISDETQSNLQVNWHITTPDRVLTNNDGKYLIQGVSCEEAKNCVEDIIPDPQDLTYEDTTGVLSISQGNTVTLPIRTYEIFGVGNEVILEDDLGNQTSYVIPGGAIDTNTTITSVAVAGGATKTISITDSDATVHTATWTDLNDNTTYTLNVAGNVITLTDNSGNAQTGTITTTTSINTDSTINGDGTVGNPLSVNFPTSTQNGGNITGAINFATGEFALNAIDTVGLTSVTTDSTLTGDGTVGSPLSVANPYVSPDGSETVVTAGTNTTVTGTGTTGDPYIVSSTSPAVQNLSVTRDDTELTASEIDMTISGGNTVSFVANPLRYNSVVPVVATVNVLSAGNWVPIATTTVTDTFVGTRPCLVSAQVNFEREIVKQDLEFRLVLTDGTLLTSAHRILEPATTATDREHVHMSNIVDIGNSFTMRLEVKNNGTSACTMHRYTGSGEDFATNFTYLIIK